MGKGVPASGCSGPAGSYGPGAGDPGIGEPMLDEPAAIPPGSGTGHAARHSSGRRNAQVGSQIIQPKRIGKRQAITPRPGCLVGVENLVKHPGHDEKPDESRAMREADQHGEDQDVSESFDELPVVHRADAGNVSPAGPPATGSDASADRSQAVPQGECRAATPGRIRSSPDPPPGGRTPGTSVCRIAGNRTPLWFRDGWRNSCEAPGGTDIVQPCVHVHVSFARNGERLTIA